MTIPHRLRLGYLPLTDSAPLIVARQLGLDRRHGLNWNCASLRGARCATSCWTPHAAAALYGLAYGMQLAWPARKPTWRC